MTQKLLSRKKVARVGFLLTVTYLISYVTRINFGAIVSEISHATGFSKSMLSLPLTGSFITYGVGQVLSGLLGDRVSPKKLVAVGLAVASVMNSLIPLCTDLWMMLVVWCINGLAQAFMWPPIVKIMSALLSSDDYKKAATQVSCGGYAGTILIYLISPITISQTNWKGVFYISSMLGVVMLIMWQLMIPEVKCVAKQPSERQEKLPVRAFLSPLIFAIMIFIVMQGMLRDGVITWIPSFIAESFHLENEVSILAGVLLPVFSILCIRFADWLYRKVVPNPIKCAGFLFGAAGIFAFGLYLSSRSNLVLSVLFSAALIGSINGVNLILISMLPPYFEKTGNVSTVSGLLNSCTYIGSALSTYGIAALSEGIGWSRTILVWVFIAVVGFAGSLLCIKPWNSKFESNC